MAKIIRTSRKVKLDEYLCMSKEVACWAYGEGNYHIIFQRWVYEDKINQIMKLIKERFLEG